MARLRIARAAQADLRDIRTYSKLAFGPAVARSYLEGMRERFALLRTHAMIGPEESDLGLGLRSIGYRSHRIYYAAQAEDVLIIRILHRSQDAARALAQERL